MAELALDKRRKGPVECQPPAIDWRTGNNGRLKRSTPSLWVGCLLVGILVLVAVGASVIAPYPPDQIRVGARLSPPNGFHLFGTDHLGRDLYSRVVHGAPLALQIAVMGIVVSAGLGVSLGMIAGYSGQWIDQILSRLIDVWLALPGLLLAILIVARLGPSLYNTALAMGLVGVPTFFRLARSSVLTARQASYVEAARSVGASSGRILIRHILPNVAPSLVVLATMRMGTLILAGGGLSFIGLGAQPPQPEWGALLALGRDYMGSAPWLAVYPGVCITLTVVGFNLLGDGLRDWMDPR